MTMITDIDDRYKLADEYQLSVSDATERLAHVRKILQVGDMVVTRSRSIGIVMTGIQKVRTGVTQSGYMVSVSLPGIQMGIDPGQLREISRDGSILYDESTLIQRGMFDG